MALTSLLLGELETELSRTRKTLERVPLKDPDFRPHPKSMSIKALAGHIAQLSDFGVSVLTTPEYRFSQGSYVPLKFEDADQLLFAFDERAATLRTALGKTSESAWQETWRLFFEQQNLFDGPRFLAYRNLFMNHVIHHRAQLGVYLRLNDIPVPSLYGPSADEPF